MTTLESPDTSSPTVAAEKFGATLLPVCQSTGDKSSGAKSEQRQRFTRDGDDALESHLELTCTRVVSGLRGLIPEAKLDAILLGGGYGRGEGGVLRGPAGDQPYNDLEFYVALTGNRHVNERRYHRRLEVLGEILTPLAG